MWQMVCNQKVSGDRLISWLVLYYLVRLYLFPRTGKNHTPLLKVSIPSSWRLQLNSFSHSDCCLQRTKTSWNIKRNSQVYLLAGREHVPPNPVKWPDPWSGNSGTVVTLSLWHTMTQGSILLLMSKSLMLQKHILGRYPLWHRLGQLFILF